MENFTYYNPTKIIFGKGTIAQLAQLVPQDNRILLVYGGGSIKKNGVYEQVLSALDGFDVEEFAGIEPNPRYETCMRAVKAVQKESIGFLLAVGGGSVLDAVKFIAAAAVFSGGDPWRILSERASITEALELGSVLTLSATGSEMNGNSVITNERSKDKLYFSSDLVRPRFSILDPQTTCSLPDKQTANGIVDAFVHATEQYLTYPVNCPLQDRQAEAILLTLIEQAPLVLKAPQDYEIRANIMWCATNALNGLIGCGVPQDWTSHEIGHELTALYGLDHGETLAVVLPAVLRHQLDRKLDKLCQYAERVWGIHGGTKQERAGAAIQKTEDFFHSIGVRTKMEQYGFSIEIASIVAAKLAKRAVLFGERGDIGAVEVEEILKLAV